MSPELAGTGGIALADAGGIFHILAFLVPGFLLHWTLSAFVPRKTEKPQVLLLQFFALSCVNYALWAWLIYLIFTSPFFKDHPARTALVWGVIILASPLALGILFGYLHPRDFVRKRLHRLGLSPIHVIPTAWDYKFSRTEDPLWVLVTLKDGSKVAGLFGSRSFASSDPGERDVYIQDMFRISDDGAWKPFPQNDGILIAGDQIRLIEFFTDKKEPDNERERQRQAPDGRSSAQG